jgi:predicted membrane-bound spermidine synthase
MSSLHKRLLFFLFFFSGFSGLVCQIVWLRLAFADFGIITPVVSIVLSLFMAGLAFGSFAGGKLVGPLCGTGRISPLVAYGIVECLIGLGAFAVPESFHLLQACLGRFGEMDSAGYLIASGGMIALSLLPWCFCMGMTFPLMMDHVRRIAPGEERGFSRLYLANVLGAVAGTSLSAVFLIELLGFQKTLWVAALSNFMIAATAFIWAATRCGSAADPPDLSSVSPGTPDASLRPLGWAALTVLFVTGFCSMAMEVAWTRAFTPITETTIYAFAFLLTVYLVATSAGSFCYRRRKSVQAGLGVLLPWLAAAAFLPIIANDPRLNPRILHIVTGLFPFCFLLGYLTPLLIDRYSGGSASGVGKAYGVNVIGCVLGPLAAGYLLLPLAGVKGTLLLLALPLLLLAMIPHRGTGREHMRWVGWMVLLVCGVLACRSTTYEDLAEGSGCKVRRDSTATVIALGQGMDKHLLVNGYGMTILTPVTKIMAHFPLALLGEKPRSALCICFGMGTTFRSLTTWGIDTTAVELVPGVRDFFGFFHGDAAEVLSRPGTRIVVDDGRRFLKRTDGKYDLITIDPPPPVEAAGSSLLYSHDFYRIIRNHLQPSGILEQWFPGGEIPILLSVARSLADAFPHVRVFRSVEGWGYYFLASDHEIFIPEVESLVGKIPQRAREDLVEWYPGTTPGDVFRALLSNEIPIEELLRAAGQSKAPMLTDDRPYNEYFLMRRYLPEWMGQSGSPR